MTSTSTPAESPTSATATSKVASTIHIRDYQFEPVQATVKAGVEITFVNDDSVPHTATAPDGAFDTGTIAPHESQTVTVGPDVLDEVHYICDIHQFMTADFTVIG